MSFFKKLFGNDESSKNKGEKDSPYLKEEKLPVDEMFALNFKENGGKFVYCDTLEEISENFINILEENDWFEKEAICFDNRLQYLLDENKIIRDNVKNPTFLLSSCETLIADNGAILFSSNQFKEYNRMNYRRTSLFSQQQVN